MVVRAGEVDEGEIIGTPFGTATLFAMAVETPEQSAPMMATTFSEVTSLSAAAVAAPASIQVESARTTTIFSPPSRLPESEASLKATSAEPAISGVNDSMGPVKPRIIPILMSANATAGRTKLPAINIATFLKNLFLFILPLEKPSQLRNQEPAEFVQN